MVSLKFIITRVQFCFYCKIRPKQQYRSKGHCLWRVRNCSNQISRNSLFVCHNHLSYQFCLSDPGYTSRTVITICEHDFNLYYDEEAIFGLFFTSLNINGVDFYTVCWNDVKGLHASGLRGIHIQILVIFYSAGALIKSSLLSTSDITHVYSLLPCLLIAD